MADVLRLRNYKTYLSDGMSSITCDVVPKSEVLVALELGYEPQKITDPSERVDIDDRILKMAEWIKLKRKEEKNARTKQTPRRKHQNR